MQKIKVGSMYLDIKSMVVGAVVIAVLSALPVVGDAVTGALNSIREMVAGLFKRGAK